MKIITVEMHPPPSFFAPYPAISALKKLFILITEGLNSKVLIINENPVILFDFCIAIFSGSSELRANHC
jgi:hypothetical protein